MTAEPIPTTSSTDLLTVRVGRADGVTTVHLIGEVDLSTAGLLSSPLAVHDYARTETTISTGRCSGAW